MPEIDSIPEAPPADAEDVPSWYNGDPGAVVPVWESFNEATLHIAKRLTQAETLDERFVTKDSGVRKEFATGSRRDSEAGKGRFDLLPIEAIRRYAQLLERGAEKYEAHNWELGQDFSRVFSSMLRHAFQAAAGETDEDHLSAVLFNAAALITFEERIARGELPPELNDMGWEKRSAVQR
ncbi:MAG: hypothetical protein QOC92_4490 [Acidimicrobiaceae bacterium]|jgi:hypothetical protein